MYTYTQLVIILYVYTVNIYLIYITLYIYSVCIICKNNITYINIICIHIHNFFNILYLYTVNTYVYIQYMRSQSECTNIMSSHELIHANAFILPAQRTNFLPLSPCPHCFFFTSYNGLYILITSPIMRSVWKIIPTNYAERKDNQLFFSPLK